MRYAKTGRCLHTDVIKVGNKYYVLYGQVIHPNFRKVSQRSSLGSAGSIQGGVGPLDETPQVYMYIY